MITLSWRQVSAWRLAQQCLAPRLESQDYVQAVKRTGGIQAQVMSAAELAIGTRVEGISPHVVQSALWKDRTLVKTWAMRAALHLLPASVYPLYVAARSLSDIRNWSYYFNYYGINQKVLEAYLAAAPEILSSEPMRREEFARAVSEQVKSPPLYELLVTKGWGTPLKPLAWQGLLCFGPNQGQNVTFVRPSAWIGEWQSVQPYSALQEMVRLYLRSFGPATVEDFTIWWGARLTPTRKLFKSLEDELATVDIEGWHAFALRATLDKIQESKISGVVNLLPLFDAYLMGIGRGQEIEPLISMAYQKQVFRPQGWISAVVLVDGLIQGIWEYKTQQAETTIMVNLFSPSSGWMQEGIAAEAERLGKFLNTKVRLQFTESKP